MAGKQKLMVVLQVRIRGIVLRSWSVSIHRTGCLTDRPSLFACQDCLVGGVVNRGDRSHHKGIHVMRAEVLPYIVGFEICGKIAQKRVGIALPDFDLTRHACSSGSTMRLVTCPAIRESCAERRAAGNIGQKRRDP